jgi:hypothetical protein
MAICWSHKKYGSNSLKKLNEPHRSFSGTTCTHFVWARALVMFGSQMVVQMQLVLRRMVRIMIVACSGTPHGHSSSWQQLTHACTRLCLHRG